MGASVSMGSMVRISPDFYEESCKPYLIEIGENLGNLAIRSCRNFLVSTPYYIIVLNYCPKKVCSLADFYTESQLYQ